MTSFFQTLCSLCLCGSMNGQRRGLLRGLPVKSSAYYWLTALVFLACSSNLPVARAAEGKLYFNPINFQAMFDFASNASTPYDSGWRVLPDNGPMPPSVSINGSVFQCDCYSGAAACPGGMNVQFYVTPITSEFPLIYARATSGGPSGPCPSPWPAYPTGPGGPGGPSPSISPDVGEPVNAITGAFYENQVDLRLNGPLPIEIKRTYSSLNSKANNEFGYGWLPGYPSYLIPSDDSADPSTIQAADTNGAGVVFRQQSGSTTVWVPTLADNP